jgi:hypothetical protein
LDRRLRGVHVHSRVLIHASRIEFRRNQYLLGNSQKSVSRIDPQNRKGSKP